MKNKRFIKTFVRAAALALSCATVFSFAGCKKVRTTSPDDAGKSDKKTAILVAPQAQYPEEYAAAKELAKEYGDAVSVFEYADSRILVPGDPDIMKISRNLANDPEIGAIIYDRATMFATYAINAAKLINPSLVFACVEPEESVERVSKVSDFVICVDWRSAASDIVETAKKRGAQYFVMFSPSRHSVKNPLVAAEAEAFKTECEKNKIKFILKDAYDPIFSGGVKKANKIIDELLSKLYEEETIKGENVVLFSTDDSVQPTILELVKSKGLIYLCPSFPTAYGALGESYKVATPKKTSDVASYLKRIKAAAKADAANKARISAYEFPLASITLRGALRAVFETLGGKVDADNLAGKVTSNLEAAADDSKLEVSLYPDSKLSNVFAVYRPGFKKIK